MPAAVVCHQVGGNEFISSGLCLHVSFVSSLSETGALSGEEATVINFKILAIAAAVLGSAVLTGPTPSQAIPLPTPMKIDAASDGNFVQVYYRHCRYGRCYPRYSHYRYYREYQPYYADNCWPCYGYYQLRVSSYRRSYGYPSFGRYYERPCFGPGPRLYFGY